MNSCSRRYWIGHPGGAWASLNAFFDSEPVRPIVPRFESAWSLGGVHRVMPSPGRHLRQWALSFPALRAGDAAELEHLLGATVGPYWWVTPDAQVRNMLTPRMSLMTDDVSPGVSVLSQMPEGGRYPCDDGSWAMTTRVVSSAVAMGWAPVVPGQPVTVSAWLAAPVAGRVTARWLNSDAAPIGSVSGVDVSGVAVLSRSSVSVPAVDVPGNAVAVQVEVSGASVVSRPQVTATDDATVWETGKGALSVDAEITSWSPEFAAWPDLVMGDVTLVVTEVGAG